MRFYWGVLGNTNNLSGQGSFKIDGYGESVITVKLVLVLCTEYYQRLL